MHLVTVVHDAALEVAAEAEQADAALSPEEWQPARGGRPGGRPLSAPRHLLGEVLVRELAEHRAINDLAALGREHGREVSAGSAKSVRCIQACQLALWTRCQPALLAYWRELADQTDRSFVSGDGR